MEHRNAHATWRRIASSLTALAAWSLSFAAIAQTPADKGVPDFTAPVRLATAAVVTITTTRRVQISEFGFMPDSFAVPTQRSGAVPETWAKPGRADRERGLASGFIVGGDGEILTNAHAVADVDQAVVRLVDGREFVGKVVGLDRTTDVALLKIDAHGLPRASLGNPAQLTRGEWVVALGAPFGLDSSATAGIVSAAQRYLPGSAVPLIQTDVAINPGSSGGPLFNLRGEVVGMNSMIFSRTGGYMGVSFSVPIDLAMKIADQLRTTGRVSRGQLGARIQELTPELARSFGLRAVAGALVLRVVPSSPADHSGLRSGDVVLGLNDCIDTDFEQLQQEVANARPGQKIALNVWRHGALQRMVLIVGEAPADLPAAPDRKPGTRDERLGLSLGDMAPVRRDRLGLASGLPVLEAHGAAALAGVQSDDIIVAIGDRPVRTLADFDAALAASPPGRPVPLLVMREGVLAYLAIEHAS